MSELLKGIKAGDFVEFDLITNPVEIESIEHEDEHRVTLLFKCHSGCWGLSYNRNGTQDQCFEETGIHSAFDIVKVIKS